LVAAGFVVLMVTVAVVVPTVSPRRAESMTVTNSDGWPATDPIDRADLRIRDPFVVTDAESGYYYLVGTGPGFPMYRSTDLEHWYGPKRVFTPPAGFWGTHRSWAPEIHRWNGRWYLFGSFATADNPDLTVADTVGTAVLVADAIDGPYTPVGTQPLTPPDEFAIDATLFVDGDGDPWIVYVREWLDPRIDYLGRMAAIRVTADLTGRVGDGVELFAADSPPWALGLPLGRVTDGPWVHRSADGSLLLLWSGTGTGGQYVTGIARSTTGLVSGPWEQDCLALFDQDGGHPMVFRTFAGDLRVIFHAPNSGQERAVIAPLVEGDGTVHIDDPAIAAPNPASCEPPPPTPNRPPEPDPVSAREPHPPAAPVVANPQLAG
jgi:hypothetical protein